MKIYKITKRLTISTATAPTKQFKKTTHSHSIENFYRTMAEGSDSAKKITITVKTPKEKQQIEVAEDADIKDVSVVYILNVPHIVVLQ